MKFMSDINILKTLEDLYIIVFMLENLKKKVFDDKLHFYINEVEKSAIVSFNMIFNKFERGVKNAS